MIEIYNKSTYEHAYNRFSTIFIKTYFDCKQKGLNTRYAVRAAKRALNYEVEQELSERPHHNKRTILKAFNDLKRDTLLIEDAIRYYKRFNEDDLG